MTEFLFDEHRRELHQQSAIAPDVMAERGYRSIGRPSGADARPRQELTQLGIPSWSTNEDWYFPGLLIPLWDPTGRLASHQYKPRSPVTDRDGKKRKYASAKGQSSVLDVHPRWSADRGSDDPALVPYIRDVRTPLWITEGVKKADALTSRGCCTVALNGVYNWRNSLGTLGAWEDIPLKGRKIRIVFDADAQTKRDVQRAMERLGNWLKHKQVAEVLYILPSAEKNGQETKGCDDFFAAGGTLDDLMASASTSPPKMPETDGAFSDANMVEILGEEVFADHVIWSDKLGWLRFDGRAWRDTSEASVSDDVRVWVLGRFSRAVDTLTKSASLTSSNAGEVEGWQGLLSATRRNRLVSDSRGHIEVAWDKLDADPAVFNTQVGLLDLVTGICRPTQPDDLVTRVSGAAFDPDAVSEAWETFLSTVLPDDEVRAFLRRLIGYAMYGTVSEHILPIFTGTGANGKGTLRDVLLAAFGDYSTEVDPELLMSSHNTRHGTFKMQLRGKRLVFASETDENRAFANATMKRLTGGDPIEANRMHKDPIVFKPSHTLVMVTNHLPKLPGDDDASWRRVRVVPFDVVIPEGQRDPKLPEKLTEPHVLAAVLAWAYAGYVEYSSIGLAAPEAVKRSTDQYRAENDVLGRFIEECLDFGSSCRVTSADLYKAYETWCRAEHEEALSKTALGKAMGRLGHESVKVNGVKVYRGVMVVNEDADESAA